jgi:uncharacterized DUF497 family protein
MTRHIHLQRKSGKKDSTAETGNEFSGRPTAKHSLRPPSYSVYFPYRMEFEYDSAKSKTNKAKHGIDFDEAQALWLDEDRIEFPARSDTEERHALMAMKDEKIWVAFYTMRGTSLRIISVRRARENEEKTYYDS